MEAEGKVMNLFHKCEKKTLRRLVLYSQAVTLTLVMTAVLVSNLFLYRSVYKNTANQRNIMVRTSLRDVDEKLERIQWDLDELTSKVTNSGILAAPENDSYFLVQTIHQYLIDMPQDAEFFIVLPDGMLLLTNRYTKESVFFTGIERFRFFDDMMGKKEEFSSSIAQSSWKILSLNGVSWMILCYEYRGLYIGAVQRMDNLFSGLTNEILQLGGTYAVMDRDRTLYQPIKVGRSGNLPLTRQNFAGDLSIEGTTEFSLLSGLSERIIVLTILLSVIAIAGVIVTDFRVNRTVVTPLNELAGTIDGLQEHVETMQIRENAEVMELWKVQHALNDLLQQVVAAKLQLMNRQVKEQEEQLRRLRSQLRSHFYLNAMMMISNMTYQNRNEEIREYLDLLSRHMRYMMRVNSETVRLMEELEHVKNYVAMQNIRFPNSVVLIEDCPRDLSEERIPHLFIDTIVENAFKHAMNLEDTLLLLITCEKKNLENFSGLSIIIEDNGKGFSDAYITSFAENMVKQDGKEDHIGLYNIRDSLRLRYHRDDLLILSNSVPHGARVELRIPLEK